MSAQRLDPRHALFTRIESFLNAYMAFPDPSYATVLALWAIGTWTYQSFDAFPYLVITAETKQAGKTRLMELLSFLCQNARPMASLTAATAFRLMGAAEDAGKGITIMFDEAESLSKENHPMRAVLNVGYRRGQTIPRVVGQEVVEFPAYSPKVFVLIGDVFDTLRDRSIVLTLRRGIPAKAYEWQEARTAGNQLAQAIQALGRYTDDVVVPSEFIGGRESEIWTPMFSLASRWCPAKREALVALASDIAALKTAPKRRYADSAQAEETAMETGYAQRALGDLLKVVGTNRYILTNDAVDALRAIPAAPWRVYRGNGLNAMTLSGLLSRFAVAPRQFKVKSATAKGKPKQVVARGYSREDVLAAVERLSGGAL